MARIFEDWDVRWYSLSSISYDSYESLASLGQLRSLARYPAPGHDVVAPLFAAAAAVAFGALFVFQDAQVVLVDAAAAVVDTFVTLFPAARVAVALEVVEALGIDGALPFGVAFAGAQPAFSPVQFLVFAEIIVDLVIAAAHVVFVRHVGSAHAASAHVVVAPVPNVRRTPSQFEPP